MNEKEQRPPLDQQTGGEIRFGQQGKDNNISLTNRQKKVYHLLSTGRYSAADISIRLGYSDPRTYIKTLRDKGIDVCDEWIEKKDTRYKVYYIPGRTEYTLFPEAEKTHHYDL